jgi:hypothetical protein
LFAAWLANEWFSPHVLGGFSRETFEINIKLLKKRQVFALLIRGQSEKPISKPDPWILKIEQYDEKFYKI